jgi:monofunctional biosynthetic peptidoglycan transglycosylase
VKRILFKSFLVSAFLGWIVYEYTTLPDVTPLKRRNPGMTALMELRDQEYRDQGRTPSRRQIWVSYDTVSDHIKKAVVVSEDAAFFSHRGVDLFEIKEAVKADWERGQLKRGASTITMQLARNLYLSPSKDPLRKLREIAIALQLENALSKRRIFEIYLNVVEWGDGIYGIEAASRHYFSKSASEVDPGEAATLAALLPSPRNPSEKALLSRRNTILNRMAKVGHIGDAELQRQSRKPLAYRGAQSLEEPAELFPAQESSY